jgi:hypothetical protein
MSLDPIAAARSRLRGRPPFVAVLGLLATLSLAVAACGLTGGATFDPTGPCVTDGRAPGAYPDLEALVPGTLEGRPPDRLDSGRNCTTVNLGTLAGHGIDEVRFAGGLWERGAESGTTLAVFTADGLTADWMGEFYEDGARQSRKTSDIVITHPTLGGDRAFRMDLVNDGRLQTIVTLDGDEPGLVRVALVSSAARDVGEKSAHEASVTAALDALTGGSAGG